MKEFDHAIAVLETAKDAAEEEISVTKNPEHLKFIEERLNSYKLAIVALKREYRKVGSSLLPAGD